MSSMHRSIREETCATWSWQVAQLGSVMPRYPDMKPENYVESSFQMLRLTSGSAAVGLFIRNCAEQL